jgi:alpha-1,3/alpha-1,6-mannosyltransferase
MICGLPVLACANGGPTESIIPFPLSSPSPVPVASLDPQPTGFLTEPTQAAFTAALLRMLMLSPTEKDALSIAARTRAKDVFSMEAMSRQLVEVIAAVKSLDSPGSNKRRLRPMWEKREMDETRFNHIRTIFLLLALLAAILIRFDII